MKTNQANIITTTLGTVTLMVLAVTTVQAQSSLKGVGAYPTGADQQKQVLTTKAVDGKGTFQHFQSNNGITKIINTNDNLNLTTFQLGGPLVDNTYIDVNSNVFGLDGIDLASLTGIGSIQPSTDAVDKAIKGTGTGFTLLVRDEVTGGVKKLKPGEIATQSGEGTLLMNSVAAANSIIDIPTANVKADQDVTKVNIFRNGIRLTLTPIIQDGVVKITVPVDATYENGDEIKVFFVR